MFYDLGQCILMPLASLENFFGCCVMDDILLVLVVSEYHMLRTCLSLPVWFIFQRL